MNPHRERAREQFPSVLLGVLGIIQALALELLWGKGVGGIGRWQALDAELAGWLQVSSVFLGIVVVWVMYATLVLRHSWVPRFVDLFFPFVLGIFEFLLVEMMAPERIAYFFALLAVVFVVAPVSTFGIFRTMIADGDVAAPPLREELRGYAPAAIAAVGLFVCAVLAKISGPASIVTSVCLIAANAGLLIQMVNFQRLWRTDLSR